MKFDHLYLSQYLSALNSSLIFYLFCKNKTACKSLTLLFQYKAAKLWNIVIIMEHSLFKLLKDIQQSGAGQYYESL